MGALNRLIQQQEAAAAAAPQGILSNADPVMLSLAAGLLSPTKTGGFGESLGAGLQAASGPLSEIRKQQAASKDKLMELQLARAKLEMEAPYYQARAEASRNKNNAKYMTDSDLVRNIKRLEDIKAGVPAAQKSIYQEMIDDFNDELLSRRGISPTEETTAKPKAEEDTEGGLWNWLTGRGSSATKKAEEAPPAQEEKPAPQPKQVEPEAEAEPQQVESQFYTGDKPPKDQPGAIKAPDGKWYVVKEGKTYPVLNK